MAFDKKYLDYSKIKVKYEVPIYLENYRYYIDKGNPIYLLY